MKPKVLAAYIDHTLLKPDCAESEIQQLCEEAVHYGFASVCVPPFYVHKASQLLGKEDSQSVRVTTVIGFPFGYSNTPAKVEEIKKAVDEGADEVDAVINFCAVKNKHWSYVENDIDSMCTAARLRGKKIKIILETAILNPEEIRHLMDILLATQPDFVRTSTGFNGTDSGQEAVKQLRQLAGAKIQVKAFGDILSSERAISLIEAGANRIGTTAAVALMRGTKG
jgi:deoxyribose-phosphate aldolase